MRPSVPSIAFLYFFLFRREKKRSALDLDAYSPFVWTLVRPIGGAILSTLRPQRVLSSARALGATPLEFTVLVLV
jgi:hypothetical protein